MKQKFSIQITILLFYKTMKSFCNIINVLVRFFKESCFNDNPKNYALLNFFRKIFNEYYHCKLPLKIVS